MSDLRTRIAAVIAKHHPDPDNYPDLCMCGYECWKDDEVQAYRFHVADAVIAELNLTREEPNQAWLDAGLPNRHRYVTEWKADDE